jgi:MFS superfamily sulfate permease-like transporter
MRMPERILQNYEWMNGYKSSYLSGDLVSAFIVSVLLVPQSLAYALLA